MIILTNKEDAKEKNIPNSKEKIITWQCGICGKIHKEVSRNIYRRKFLCSCHKLQAQIHSIETRLNAINYTFLYKEKKAYQLGKSQEEIDASKKPILVKCLNCGKISFEYLDNILSGHKKCNCNILKNYTNNLTAEEFIDKWPDFNKKHWKLLDTNYIGRNYKYRVQCNNCQAIEERWGMSLIDHELRCKSCSYISIGEQKIKDYLEKHNIEYQREYKINISKSVFRFFDFWIPNKNLFIEFNGAQHYYPVKNWGGEKTLKVQQERDKSKIDWCKKNNHDLLIIRYDEDIEKALNKIFF